MRLRRLFQCDLHSILPGIRRGWYLAGPPSVADFFAPKGKVYVECRFCVWSYLVDRAHEDWLHMLVESIRAHTHSAFEPPKPRVP